MELCGGNQRVPSCPPPSRGCARVSVSKELLAAGSGSGAGILDRLLINSRPSSEKNSTLQTVRVERSPLLDQVRTFLPQMAQANEKLRREMATAPPGRFDIENVDGTLGRIVQMDVALFEMSQSDSKEDDSSEESSESEGEDDSLPYEVNINNIKLPNSQGGKGKIEVLDSPASKKKEIVE
ncbi:NOP protein chaperone 1 [Tamandua tetradactyla]|uniref:NOP protein chaperone 1 n=1 Tax=Tamandua tetradactyla TaxID=48850 RepID=UPI004053D2AC